MPAFSPIPSSQGKGNSNNNSATSVISKEYLDAVSVMNEDAMNRACHLLLKAYDSDDGNSTNAEANDSTQPIKKKKSETDPKSNTQSTKSVQDQLLEMYYRCQESLTVIRKQQSLPPGINLKSTSHPGKMLPPGAPSLNGKKKRTVMTSKHGIHPSHKTSTSAIGLAMAMKRKASLNNLKLGVTVNKATGMSAAAHGKAMLGHRGRSISPPQPSSMLRSSGDDSSSAAPPPSALSFLAKLNRDPNEALAEDTKSAKRSKEDDSSEEKEGSDRSKKKKKKKTKGKQKHSDEDESTVAKEKSEETDDADKEEGHENRKRKRRRRSNSDGDTNEKSSESLSKQENASKKRRNRNEDEEEEDAPSSNDDDDNDDGDTSADETYRGSGETSSTRRTSISRKAKPDAETLAGKSPTSKRRKTRNQSTEAAPESNEDPSPSRRRNPRRGS